MIDPKSAQALAYSYNYHRDRRARTNQEIERLESTVKGMRTILQGLSTNEKTTYEAFENLFALVRVGDLQHPHCDPWVLHAPGKCEFCDMHPEAQALRVLHGVCFTGVPEEGKCQCPSELLRGIKIVNRWPGNRPAPKAE